MNKFLLVLVLLVLYTCAFPSDHDIDVRCARLSNDAYRKNHELGSYDYAKPVKRITDDFYKLAANIYEDTTNKIVYVAIRGTEFSNDWGNNFNFPREDLVFHVNGQNQTFGLVHGGFSNKAEHLALQIEKAIKSYAGKKYHFVVTGHSQGAANAYLVALHFTLQLGIKNVRVVTFGSPKVGNDEYVKAVEEHIPLTRRYVTYHGLARNRDPITMVPTMLGMFKHVGKPIWIRAPMTTLNIHSMSVYEKGIRELKQEEDGPEEPENDDAEMMSDEDGKQILRIAIMLGKLARSK